MAGRVNKMTAKNKVPAIRFGGFSGEWEEKELNYEVDFYNGLTYSPNDVIKGTGTFVLRSSNVKKGEIIDADNIYVVSDVVNSENVRVGDIIVVVRNGSRSLIGKHAQVKQKMDNTVIGAFMTGIHAENSTFINALLDTNQFNKEIEKNLGATINQITNGAFKKMQFWFSSPDEQTKIGNYFQQLDILIAQHQQKHDKLLSLKKSLLEKMFSKQGATVPKIRFKGFSGGWEENTLGEIGETYSGLSGKTKEDFGHGKANFVTYMNVFSNSVTSKLLVEPIEVDKKQNEVRFGDVFFTTSSETPEEVGMSSVWMGEVGNVYLNSFCFGYRPKQKFDNYYLASTLRSSSFRQQIILLAQGISRYNISKNKAMDILLLVPKFEEQIKIGNLFKHLDTLLSQHQAQLKKLNNIKQACLAKMFV